MLKVLSVLFSFLLICSLKINVSNARSIFFPGEWLTISQLAQQHSDWLTKDKQLSSLIGKAVYIVNEQYTQLFSAAICKVNLTTVAQYIQQDVCSLQYVCGKPFNKCYQEDIAIENLIWGDIYILIDNNGLPHKLEFNEHHQE